MPSAHEFRNPPINFLRNMQDPALPVAMTSSDILPVTSHESFSIGSMGWLKIAMGLFAALIALLGLWHNRGPFLHFVNNSDLLYIPALYHDFVTPHRHVIGWHITPAPYFVPDIPVYFVLQAITRTIARAYAAYELVSLAAIMAVFYWIAGAVTPRRPNRLMVAGLIGLVVFVLSRNPSSSYWTITKFVLAPSAHGGGALLGLFIIRLGLRLMQRRSWWGLGWLLLLCFGGVASDKSVLSNYMVPLVLTALIAACFRKIKFINMLLIWITAGLATAGGLRLLQLLDDRHVFVIPQTPEYLSLGSWSLFQKELPDFFSIKMPLFWIFAIAIVSGLIFIWHYRKTITRQRIAPNNQFAFHTAFMLLITMGSIVGTVLSVVDFGLWLDLNSLRFLMPLMLLPLVLVGLIAVNILERCRPEGGAIAGGVVLIAACAVCIPGRSAAPVTSAVYYPPRLVQFDNIVRKYHLHNGFAQYWQARPLSLENKTGTLVHAITDKLLPSFWISNPRNLVTRKTAVNGYPPFDFIIPTGLNRAAVLKKFGEPAVVAPADDLEVFIYNRPQDVLVRNFGRGAALAEVRANIKTKPRIKTPRQLNWLRTPGTDWNAPGVLIIPDGGHLTATLDHESICNYFEISADSNDVYSITFLDHGKPVGHCVAPALDADGLEPRDFNLTPILHNAPFDSLIIQPSGGDHYYSVGYVLMLGH